MSPELPNSLSDGIVAERLLHLRIGEDELGERGSDVLERGGDGEIRDRWGVPLTETDQPMKPDTCAASTGSVISSR
jgi:hypothetical protein